MEQTWVSRFFCVLLKRLLCGSDRLHWGRFIVEGNMKRLVMVLVIAGLLFGGFVSPAKADDTWTTGQKVGAGLFVAGAVIDYLQTTSALDEGRKELFGIKDKTEATLVMGGLTVLLLALANNNPKLRTGLLTGGNAAVWSFVIHNNGVGIRINF
jgi:hypothetical protein